ncbi:hypothetical protein [Rhodococcus sp. H29-C3]|uniref:hypothetical protein n=1 Tax=Rhodococcus sp. H29-C3 TaxID=3046307 RepID=UPI0024B9C402|nr:hypothetical protein [Rhodococcus sp. H29-C3]MDJ0362502.1 hypothetical protein [Rhodococcus sp. H29-C3]
MPVRTSPDTAVAWSRCRCCSSAAEWDSRRGLVDGQALALVPVEKVGMAAGVVNTFRLGSEAIAVAVYASILTGVVGARAASAAESIYGVSDPAALGTAAASGDLDTALGTAPDAASDRVSTTVVDSCNSGFHTTLVTMTAIVAAVAVAVAVAVAIAALLRRGTDR